jgi:curved DNA-binding protein CbpA
MEPDYYELLGVNIHSSTAEIEQAYKSKARIYHPDRNSSIDATAQFQAVKKAYDTLTDPQMKLEYDTRQRTQRFLHTRADELLKSADKTIEEFRASLEREQREFEAQNEQRRKQEEQQLLQRNEEARLRAEADRVRAEAEQQRINAENIAKEQARSYNNQTYGQHRTYHHNPHQYQPHDTYVTISREYLQKLIHNMNSLTDRVTMLETQMRELQQNRPADSSPWHKRFFN